MRLFPVLVLLMAAACAHAPATGEPLPPLDLIIAAPESPPIDAAPLAHVLRGLYSMQRGRPGDAIPHFKLALVYAPTSAFLHEQLSRAWGATGDEEKAREALAAGLAAQADDPWLNLFAAELDAYDRKYAAAAARLGKAVRVSEQEPDLATPRLERAAPLFVETLLWLGRRVEARTRAKALAERPLSSPELVASVAGHLEDHQELSAALELYRRARLLRPSDRSSAFGEARVLALQGHAAAAADALVPLFAHYPDDLQLYIEMARLLHRADSKEAASYRHEALVQAQGDALGKSSVALADLHEGRTAAGLALLREAVREAPALHDLRIVLAETLLRHGDAPGCLKALGDDRAVELLRPRALCLAGLRQTDNALDELAAAAQDGAALRDVLSDAVRVLGQQVEEAEARRRLTALITRVSVGGDEAEARMARSLLADLYGHGDEAKSLIADLAGGASGDVDVVMRFADLRARYQELAAGRAVLERLVSERPFDPVRLNALGFTLADAGVALEEASVWLRRAYRIAPEEGFIIDSLGWLLYRQGRRQEALALLLRASRAAPGDPEILAHLGDVYAALGNHGAAAAAYQAAMETRPPPMLRKRIEARLKRRSW